MTFFRTLSWKWRKIGHQVTLSSPLPGGMEFLQSAATLPRLHLQRGIEINRKKTRKSATTKVMDLDIEIANANSQAAKSSVENSTGSSRTKQSKL
jgi:hypothetical protein